MQYDSKSLITIKRNGQVTGTNTLEDIHNAHTYSGNDNYIMHSRIYTHEFTCRFEFAYYPFDRQHCTMDFILRVGNSMSLSVR